ncbi:Nn.00g055420.m01.CDS01 [Neocucurbitaria sp. VM-36]
MSFQTPRRLNPLRPSLNPTASSPNLSLTAQQQFARKASLNALVGGASPPANRMGADGRDIGVGDAVDVPGGMHGVVKFIGSVSGKKGVFAGVELSREYAARGKNDGEVEGTQYFKTSIPGSGIFLPVHRASKRSSADSSDFPPTPTTPSYNNNFSLSTTEKPNFSPDTPSIHKFSQSVGPGARAPSPQFKPPKGRPSLPRPESPYRQKPILTATPGRNGGLTPSGFSKSAIGAPPRFASPAPPRFNSPAPPRAAPLQKPRTPGPSRPYSRNNSRLGQHDTIDEDSETTPVGATRTSNDSMASFKNRRPGSRPGSNHTEEVQRLTKLLEERDKQLKDQAASLSEMEASLSEIQSLIPEDGMDFGSSQSNGEPNDVGQLRVLLREKNDKIAMLTSEFDAHRSDFRSTIDTLELASTETERVYEKKVEELQEELREYQSRSEDVETVAMQLKQLEELVQELEEGLEDARRGEAEARGEVEFLRGEVERGRSELRREREKAAAALKGANTMVDGPHTPGQREVEQRDDEIRGLKAIIHSLSSGGAEDHGRSPLSRKGSSVNPEELRTAQANADRLEREKEELRGLVERKAYREEELERELEKLKSQLGLVEQRESMISNGMSEHTATQEKRSSGRDSKGTVVTWRDSPRREVPPALAPMAESDGRSSANSSLLWCEICETGGHDILNCSAMGGGEDSHPNKENGARNGKDVVIEGLRNLSVSSDRTRPSVLNPSKPPGSAPTAPLPIPAFDNANSSLVPPKGAAVADPDKWCALCESEGHDVTACPNEDAF